VCNHKSWVIDPDNEFSVGSGPDPVTDIDPANDAGSDTDNDSDNDSDDNIDIDSDHDTAHSGNDFDPTNDPDKRILLVSLIIYVLSIPTNKHKSTTNSKV